MGGLHNESRIAWTTKDSKDRESNIMLREGKMAFPVFGPLPPQSGQRFRIQNFLLVARDNANR